jgi:hypothetical protein
MKILYILLIIFCNLDIAYSITLDEMNKNTILDHGQKEFKDVKKGDIISWDNLKNKGISCEAIKTEDVIDCLVLNSYAICLIANDIERDGIGCDYFLNRLKADIHLICKIPINAKAISNKEDYYLLYNERKQIKKKNNGLEKLIKETFCNKLDLDVEGNIKFTPQILQTLSKNREKIFKKDVVFYSYCIKDNICGVSFTKEYYKKFHDSYPFVNVNDISFKKISDNIYKIRHPYYYTGCVLEDFYYAKDPKDPKYQHCNWE